MRVAVLFDNFGPYHHARLAAAAGACDLLAVEFGSRSGEYAWAAQGSDKLRHQVVNPDGPGAAMPAAVFRERLERILSDFVPAAVVIPGWSNRGGFMAMAWARTHRVPIVLMSESTAWDEARVGWKEWVKRRVVRLSSAALVGGQPHADYMCQLGMKEQQVFLGYDAVDNDYYRAEAAGWQKLKTESLKAESETEEPSLMDAPAINSQPSTLNRPPYFLASNRFIEKKNLFRLLEAYGGCARNGETLKRGKAEKRVWDLCLLGDGELKEKLIAHCATLGLHVVESAPWEVSGKTESSFQLSDLSVSAFPTPTVYFPGFRQVGELPRFYANAGAFVHASTTEQWGLVVNEAMASGLPVIVSNRVGCAQDLVQEGINGFTFDPTDVAQLTDLMVKVSAFPPATLSGFGEASQRIVANWGPERFASGLQAAAAKAATLPLARAGLIDRALLTLLGNR